VSATPGTVVYVNFNPVYGREQDGEARAALVVSPQFGAMQVVVPLTSNDRPMPTRAPVTSDPRYGRESYAMCEQVRAVDVGRYVDTAHRVSADELARVRNVLAGVLLFGDTDS
jgi:mRNA-degrading endonuclease toxin of MazEF toxin-antitoxin module